MRLIRILHARGFNWDKRRFQSSYFKRIGNGISVIDRDCVFENYNTSICEHIRTFYSIVAGDPIVYWPFESSILGEKARLVSRISTAGDICHYDIENISHKEGRDIFRNYASNANLYICNNDNEDKFSIEKFKDFIK